MLRSIGWSVLLLLGPSRADGQLRLVPLDIRVPRNPAAAWTSGRAHYVYELRITNVGRQGVGVQRVEVSANGAVVGSWSGDSLKGAILRMGEVGDGRVIGAGRQSLLYLFVTVAAPVATLDHRFLVTNPDSLAGPARDTVTGFRVETDPTPAVAIHAPLRGGPWVAGNGPSNTSGHRRTVIPLDGVGRIAQRFATDWVKIGPDGALWQGDSTKNQNWYGYRQPLLAVAAGTVVATKDGIPENVPLAPDRAVPITLETVGGNHVIIDLGGRRYAFYAHMVPGSLMVKVGDKVKPGDVIGLLGNSGNSDAPHLHFHVGEAPFPLKSEGLPFALDEYVVLGQTTDVLARWKAAGAPRQERQAIPAENEVVQFKP